MASTSLSPNRDTERLRQLYAAAITLAMMRAKQAVRDALRRKGAKVSLVPSCQITAMAKTYLHEHRDALMAEAKATVEQWVAEGLFGKRAQREWRANLSSAAQRPDHCSSNQISVQMLGANGRPNNDRWLCEGQHRRPEPCGARCCLARGWPPRSLLRSRPEPRHIANNSHAPLARWSKATP
jgi:hypothetical protein